MDLPYLTADLPGIGGVLRSRPEDFVVDEELPYAASGAGSHVFVKIEKIGVATNAAVAAIARALGVRERDIGVAGMKDRHAVTRQWISVPPPIAPEAVLAIALPNVRVLEATRHEHKLRTGHVRANRFTLVVRGVAAGAVDRAGAILEELARAPGAPNWYGEQRFGRDGDNAARGRAIVLGETPLGRDHKLDRLMVSALQSHLFNTWLTARVADGLYRTAIAGDVLHKVGGGLFDCAEPDVDGPRVAAGEVVPTGPMFGDRMRRPPEGSAAAAREDRILVDASLAREDFGRVRRLAEGTRRDAAIAVRDVRVTALLDDALEVAFTLPGGAYATTVMREIMKVPSDGRARRESSPSPDSPESPDTRESGDAG